MQGIRQLAHAVVLSVEEVEHLAHQVRTRDEITSTPIRDDRLHQTLKAVCKQEKFV